MKIYVVSPPGVAFAVRANFASRNLQTWFKWGHRSLWPNIFKQHRMDMWYVTDMCIPFCWRFPNAISMLHSPVQPVWTYKVPDEYKPPPRVNKKTRPRNFCSFCKTCSRFSAKEMLSAPWPVKGPNKSRMWWISTLSSQVFPASFQEPPWFQIWHVQGQNWHLS